AGPGPRPEGELNPFRPRVRRGPAYNVLRYCGATSFMLRYCVLPPAHPAGASVSDARHEVRLTHLDQADRTLLRIGEGVGDERVHPFTTGPFLEHRLEDGAAACRDGPRLHAVQHVLRVPVRVDPVEHRADDVEVAAQARPRVDHEDSDAVADVDLKRMLLVLE